jgi:serine/threonine protein kinase
LYDVYIVTPDDKIFIVMELMEGGELFDYVVQKGTLTEEEASYIVQKVTSALVFMHSKNIMHRDLKPENLLLKKAPTFISSSSSNTNKSNSGNNTNNHNLNVKVIDFGLSKALKEEQPVAQTFLGTRGYLAPEMLQRLDYTRAVDTWALGVIVFVLLCGCLPFDDDTSAVPSDDVVKAKFVLRFPRWAKTLSPSAKDLLSHLLDVNPRTRYTAQQALDHPWVRGVTVRKDNLLQSPGRIKKSPLLISSIKSQARKVPGTSMNPTPVMSKTAARRYGAGTTTPDSHDSSTPTTPSTIYTKMISPANVTTGTRKAVTIIRQASL